MLQSFQNYIIENSLLQFQQPVLLAVSGGIDSIVMAHLVQQLGCKACIAHCNFHLRAGESDGDQAFVEEQAKKLGFDITVKHFNTNEYARQQGISIQMAARDLRYEWFNQLVTEKQFEAVAVAHNLDDVVETILMNLGRGTGIKGLSGIKPKNGNVVRPLLFASRDQIEHYANEHHLRYRNDSSNSNTKYLRNAIRHKLIPVFKDIFPAFQQNVIHTAHCLMAVENEYTTRLDDIKNQLFTFGNSELYVDINKVKSMNISSFLLFDLLIDYHFHHDVICDLLGNLDGQTGIRYYSPTHVLLIDRGQLVIRAQNETQYTEYLIDTETTTIEQPFKMKIRRLSNFSTNKLPRSGSHIWLDASKLQFPLVLRPWQHGDCFYPLGMKGQKKISDFFTDQKLSQFRKEDTWLLTSGSDIIWVVGMRIDDRYKITANSSEVLELMIENNIDEYDE